MFVEHCKYREKGRKTVNFISEERESSSDEDDENSDGAGFQ